jgi:hypothetical protein
MGSLTFWPRRSRVLLKTSPLVSNLFFSPTPSSTGKYANWIWYCEHVIQKVPLYHCCACNWFHIYITFALAMYCWWRSTFSKTFFDTSPIKAHASVLRKYFVKSPWHHQSVTCWLIWFPLSKKAIITRMRRGLVWAREGLFLIGLGMGSAGFLYD